MQKRPLSVKSRKAGLSASVQSESRRVGSALFLLNKIEVSGRSVDSLTASFLRANSKFRGRELGHLLELLDAVLRRQAALDWHLSKVGQALPINARTRLLAHLALVEKMSSSRIRDAFAYAADIAPLNGEEANLLRRLSECKLDDPRFPDWVRGAFPPWLKGELKEAFGAKYLNEMIALAEPSPLDFRVNLLKAKVDDVKMELSAAQLPVERMPLSPLGLRLRHRFDLSTLAALSEGRVEPQDEGSQLAALLADVRPGQFVVDYCAGAGGKTLVLAAQMENRGRLLATDVMPGRLMRARTRLRRAGVHVAELRDSSEDRRWLKRQFGRADRVLVDAPCSGIGSWRRIPDARWRLAPEDLAELEVKQAEILRAAAKLVKPEGRLIYVTCSILPRENEHQVARFLEENSEFAILPYGEIWPSVSPAPPPDNRDVLQLTPYRHGTGGFFIAVFQRSVKSAPTAEAK